MARTLLLAACVGMTLLTGSLAPARSVEPPVPAMPVAHPIPVKVVVIANFEPGKDMGDEPGEFQLWAEREHLDQVIAIMGALHPLRRNTAGLYGMVWGDTGSMVGGVAEQLEALVLDPRFDFRKTYWLFTGISGADPNLASVGSAAWARWVVQGDSPKTNAQTWAHQGTGHEPALLRRTP